MDVMDDRLVFDIYLETPLLSLYDSSIERVYHQYVIDNVFEFNFNFFPPRITHDLICKVLKQGCTAHTEKLVNKLGLIAWVNLLKCEKYKETLLKFIQTLVNNDYPVGDHLIRLYSETHSLDLCILKHIEYGLLLGSFLAEGSWYEESEKVLTLVEHSFKLLPDHKEFYLIRLEFLHRLFSTLSMSFKFERAEELLKDIKQFLPKLQTCDTPVNYALLFTEFSKYSFSRNDYRSAYEYIREAIQYLNDDSPACTSIQVLQQASKVHVVKRDFRKAKYFIYQALLRAESYYGPDSYRMVGSMLDYGFYLLNADRTNQSVSTYMEAFYRRTDLFGCQSNNLHIAIVEENLAYALYVQKYSDGDFSLALLHTERAIAIMKRLLPSDNLMLSSAHRVKALILEEIALETFTNQSEEGEDHDDAEIPAVNVAKLEEAEALHKSALQLTMRTFGEMNILTAKQYGNLGRLYQSMKKYSEAEKMHLKAIEIKEKILGPNDYEVGVSVGHLASLYNYHMKKYEEAEKLYFRSIDINLQLFPETYSGFEYDYRGLMHVYEHLADPELYLKFSNTYSKWRRLRNGFTEPESARFDYQSVPIEPIISIVKVFETSSFALVDESSNIKH